MGKHEYNSPLKLSTPGSPLQTHQMKKRTRSSVSEEERRMSTDTPDSKPDEKEEPLTLLQKAEKFRRQHEDKWRERQRQLRQRSLELKGFITPDPIVKWYNDKVAEERRQSIEVERLRRLEPRKLTAYVQFAKSDQQGADTASIHSSDRLSIGSNSSSYESQSTVELKHGIEEDDRDEESFEMTLTLETGFNLYNGVKRDEERMEKCHVKLYVFPDEEKHDTAVKSTYRHISTTGVTRWEHRFSVKGLSPKMMNSRYMVLSLTGKNSSRKISMGQAILAGGQARIKSERQVRLPTTHEKESVIEALDNPDASIPVTLELDNEDYVTPVSGIRKGKHRQLNILRKNSVRKRRKASKDLSKSS